MKLFSVLKGGPGMILAVLAVGGMAVAYVHQREVAAVERAALQRQLDSLSAVWTADSIAAAHRDSARVDSIAKLQAAADHALQTAHEDSATFDFNRRALRSIIPNGQRLLLDSMTAAHGREVASYKSALATAARIHLLDLARIADRDRQISELRQSRYALTEQIRDLNARAHPGPLKAILQSPYTHAGAFGVGLIGGLLLH
jgi:hypothetical protein